jgi:Xaa-Pro aminopeptidase
LFWYERCGITYRNVLFFYTMLKSNHLTILVLLFGFTANSYAQTENPVKLDIGVKNGVSDYDEDLLTPEFHKKKRDALRALLPANSMAVFFSSPVRNRSNDVNYEYHQDPNFYYLTGLTEPDAVLIVFKDQNSYGEVITNEIVFVQPRDSSDEKWTGKRLGAAGVKEKLGIETAFENTQFADFELHYNKFDKIFSMAIPDDVRDDKLDRGDLASMLKYFKRDVDSLGKKLNKFELSTYMAQLREIKTKEELYLLRQAITITCNAITQLMKTLKPGMKEYQGEAIVEYCFHSHGAEHSGYPSILGSGENGCVLHYESNRKTVKSDEMIVCDAGAEYHGYTADVTRTIPVDGKFSVEEKIIYNLVLDAQTQAIATCKPGAKFYDPNNKANEIIARGLMNLGIISKLGDVKLYFPHGTSHYLGLDVHDAGLYGVLTPGQVITVEPGIYIPAGSKCDKKWWNIGVRIEDDILITTTGYENLSACVPSNADEIERMMAQKGQFEEFYPNK